MSNGMRLISSLLLIIAASLVGVSPEASAASSPIAGSLDVVRQVPGAVRVVGWALDTGSTAPINVDIYANNNGQRRLLANLARPDVASAFPAVGGAHGFDANIPLPEGQYTVCAIAIYAPNEGLDRNIGCRQVFVSGRSIGSLDMVRQESGGVHLIGWALDPNTTAPINVDIYANGLGQQRVLASASRPDIGGGYPEYGSSHGFDLVLNIPSGTQTVCARAINSDGVSPNPTIGCVTLIVYNSVIGRLDTVVQVPGGLRVIGWAIDPTSAASVNVDIFANGSGLQRLAANLTRPDIAAAYPTYGAAHGFDATITTPPDGQINFCAVGIKATATTNGQLGCIPLKTGFSPFGILDYLGRTSATQIYVAGWAADPDTSASLSVNVSLVGVTTVLTGNQSRPDVANAYNIAPAHGFSTTLNTTSGEHMVCVTVTDVGPGNDLSFGCRDIVAVGATAPSVPLNQNAIAGFGVATITWDAPLSTGGAQITTFTIVASSGGITAVVGADQRSVTVSGLASGGAYHFAVSAQNAVGSSIQVLTPTIVAYTSPGPQTTTPPLARSRYIRNLTGGPGDVTYWRAAGAADAAANPSGHWYASLLDIGGQGNGGVALSAVGTWVSYATLVTAIQAYVDGYASAQQPSAPVWIALGTNNDMTVNASTGADWATQVVNPVSRYAGKYISGIAIVGANDIEPGFRAGPSATLSWLQGYLGATGQPFVFNGSADGCNWSAPNGSCNNGWTASYLYQLSAGMAPTRMIALPQIYNTTMAKQWKYISLTGSVNGWPRVNLGGALTEVMACAQANGACYSMDPGAAWNALWSQIQSDPRTALGTLPWVTDLRIN